MNRQTVTIGAALLGVVVVALGLVVYFSGDDDPADTPVTGPGRAAGRPGAALGV